LCLLIKPNNNSNNNNNKHKWCSQLPQSHNQCQKIPILTFNQQHSRELHPTKPVKIQLLSSNSNNPLPKWPLPNLDWCNPMLRILWINSYLSWILLTVKFLDLWTWEVLLLLLKLTNKSSRCNSSLNKRCKKLSKRMLKSDWRTY